MYPERQVFLKTSRSEFSQGELLQNLFNSNLRIPLSNSGSCFRCHLLQPLTSHEISERDFSFNNTCASGLKNRNRSCFCDVVRHLSVSGKIKHLVDVTLVVGVAPKDDAAVIAVLRQSTGPITKRIPMFHI